MTILLLTKRPELFFKRMDEALSTGMVNKDWLESWLDGKPPENVIFGTSVENQAMAELRIPRLLSIPAANRFVSFEPLLGPVNSGLDGISEIVIGGESGRNPRPCNVEWIRSLARQGQEAGVKVHVKQLGAFSIEEQGSQRRRILYDDPKGGNPSELPEDLREFSVLG